MSATENFEIRTYGKSELAMLYFPKALTPNGALSNLNFWIRTNKELVNALRQCGMPPKAKSYTPREVALIVHHLGTP
jgi:hypothetical protein